MTMDTIVKIIGIVIVVMSVLFVIKPAVISAIAGYLKQGRRIYAVGLLRLVVAVVFLLAATACRVPWVIGLFGVLFIISGSLVFMLGSGRTRRILEWYVKQPSWLLRVMGIPVFVIGAIVVYAA